MIRRLENCPAPAKLNLFLHVTGRRPDGYHLLQSVFQLIDKADLLHFATREDEQILRSTEVAGVPQESDLIIRAAHLLRDAARAKGIETPCGATIAVEKRLPMGGGLGGGSSDAATTLMVLNHLWETGFSQRELMALGLQLGADVPFFLFGQNAFAEGVGEDLAAIDTPECWFLVIEPGVQVPTMRIFSDPELTRDTKPVRITDFSNASISNGKNDLQAVATRLFPPIAHAIAWLGKYGEARMTGSGACVFCPFEREEQADEVLSQIPPSWKAWKARSMRRHPLAHLLAS